ncbi:hypothetical protein HYS28_02765, partial [Candidatus Uhrbacteria bacterium]|nr:hypothetical protein [Candidatus Uhrbacteria bacterium]
MTVTAATTMRRRIASMLLACLVFLGATLLAVSGVSAVSAPNILSYQGRVLNANGVPVSDATASISFALYTASSGGTCLWSNNSATCASVVARTSVFADNATVYLEVIIAGETLTPRKQIVAAPYAMNADTVDGFTTTQVGGTSALVPVFDPFGNLVVTGSPQSSDVSGGSVLINPGAGVVAADETLFGIAVGGALRFLVDGEGDAVHLGDMSVNGGDFTTTASTFNFITANATTVNMASAATALNIADAATTSTIDIGGVTSDGTTTVNIATHNTSADIITIGNVNASTTTTVIGGDDWQIAANGLITTANNLAVNGGQITSTSSMILSSSGGDISINPNGSGLVYVTAGDDFAVGANALIAPFSVDDGTNTVRIGDGASDTNDPSIVMYASDAADSGTFSFTDDDRFSMTGGNFTFTGNGQLPSVALGLNEEFNLDSTFTGTSSPNLNTIEFYSLGVSNTYSAIENTTSTDHVTGGILSNLVLNGSTATVTNAYAGRFYLTNNSTNASLVQGSGYLASLEGVALHGAAATVASLYGVNGTVSASAGTVSTAVGVFGQVTTGAGTLTSSYAGRFGNTVAGTNRYGVWAEASGGAGQNFAGYFSGSRVQIDADGTPDVPGLATGAGDLFITDALETDGSVTFGDTSGTDTFGFTSAVTTTTAASMVLDSLTSGIGFQISRADSGADFDGSLFRVTQNDTGAGVDADALVIDNLGGGNSVGLYIAQSTLSAHVANSIGNNALVIDVMEGSGSENMIIARSDADGTPDTEFRVESDGDVFGDGAAYTAGADYAEFFKTSDASLGDYHVVCQDPAVAESVRRCDPGSDAYVMGVVSTNAAFVGNNFRGASEDMSNDPNYRKIGMVGQIDTLVNAGEGAIAIGDPITNSSVTTGYGAKSHGPARIVGFALEPLASGTGVIRVLVQPQWYGGDVLTSDGSAIVSGDDLVLAPLATATASASYASQGIALRGSGWSGGTAVAKDMTLRTSVTNGDDAYRLSVVNDNGAEVAYIGEGGDLAIAGKLYPSDRGTLQTSKYISYDGSAGAGGDFMRTNASGWGTGSYDFAEMFPSQQTLAAGEVVVFAANDEEVQRSTGIAYDDRIAGVISTRPGFLAGENLPGHVPVALAGRVPTYVSGENGAIAIGDPLTTSTKAGYAMKATEAGPIIGYAMEAWSGTTGAIIAFIRPSYYDGGPVEEAPAAENTASQLASVTDLNISGSMNMNGGSILSVASLSGIGGNWSLSESGDFVTRSRVTSLVRGYDGKEISTVAALGRETTIQLSGTTTLRGGSAHVEFDDVDPEFSNIIANTVPYRVIVTPYGATSQLYVAERSIDGFVIREAGSSTGVSVDWLVIAYHKDFAPEQLVEDVLAPEEALPTDVIPEAEELTPEQAVAEPVEVEPIGDEEPVAETPAADAPIEEVSAEGETASEEAAAAEAEIVEPVVAEEPVVAPAVAEEQPAEDAAVEAPVPTEPSAPALDAA